MTDKDNNTGRLRLLSGSRGRHVMMAVAALAVIGLVFVLSSGPEESWAEKEAAKDIDLDAPVGGPFALTGVDGQIVHAEDFKGKMMLMVFGYTYCPDVCPMSLLAVSNALYDLEKTQPEVASQIAPIFVTLDPERDTPEMLATYLKSFHPRITGLTGSVPDIKRMTTAYAVSFSKAEDEAFSDYLIDHTTNIMLMNTDGRYLTHYSPQTPPDLMAMSLKRYAPKS
jgi:protein SCO1/2